MNSEERIRLLLADYDDELIGDNTQFMTRHRGLAQLTIRDDQSAWLILATSGGMFEQGLVDEDGELVVASEN